MAPIPIVTACFGTSSSFLKNLEFAFIVEGVKLTVWVFLKKQFDGSLKPICPSNPIPKS